MPCISSSTKTRLQEQIIKLDALLIKAYTAYEDSLTEVSKYRFDSAEAAQQAELRDPDSLLSQIDKLESRKSAIERRLSGTGIVNMNLRRKQYNRSFNGR